jgi:hypothetical protein
MNHPETCKLVYWISTGLFSAAMLMAAVQYLTNDKLKAAFVHLGFPTYFRVELAIAKVLGVLVLLVPFVPEITKEWAYAGFTITLISAFTAHVAKKDSIKMIAPPVVMLAILAVSYHAFHTLMLN